MRTRDACGLGIALMLSAGVNAQGFAPLRLSDTGDTCYSWNGGNFSAGSFSKCQPVIVLAQAKPALPPPVQPSPVMMPLSAPVTCAPPPHKPVIHHKPKPRKTC